MKSKNRVKNLGEVYTPNFVVKDMVGRMKDLNFSSKFFEPGCGDGNFIEEIIKLKFKLASQTNEIKKLKKVDDDSKLANFIILQAISSIYGVDVDKKNIEECRLRFFVTFESEYKKIFKKTPNQDFTNLIRQIINCNIVQGDLINGTSKILINEYSALDGMKINLKTYNYEDLIFRTDEVFKDDSKLFYHIPTPVKEHSPVYFMI